MKRRLNLFDQRKSTKKAVSYVTLLRKISFWLFLTLIVVVLGLGGTFLYLRYQENQLVEKQQSLSQYIAANQEFSQEIQHFLFKFETLKVYLQQDAQSYQYFAKLLGVLNTTTSQENLTLFEINNARESTIGIEFLSYEDAMIFIDAIETPLFQDVFESITLEGFDAVAENQNAYNLTLKGTFAPIPTYGS